MSITLSALQKQRTDTAANWTTANPTLLSGELGFESDTGKAKLGTGSTAWNSLGYLGVIPSSGIYPLTQLLLPSGTAGAPSLSFVGDTNTGIYSPGADQVAISTNGTGRFFVDASGRVGAGTSAPQGSLHIHDGAATISRIRLTNSTTTDASGKGLLIAQNGVDLNVTNNEAGFLAFATSGTERMRLTSTGSLGLGTSAPSERLHVSGKLLLSNGTDSYFDAASTNGLVITNPTAIRFEVGSERLRIDSSGRVGIGTTSPGAVLHLAGNADQRFTNTTNTSGFDIGLLAGTGSADAYVFNRANAAVIFGTNNGEAGRFDSSKRLLVGTSDGSGSVGRIIAQGASNGSATGVLQVAYNGSATAPLSAGTQLGFLRFTDQASNGNVFAQIQAEVDATSGSGDYPGRLVFSTTADGASSPTERMRLTQQGILKISNDGTYANSTGPYHEFVSSYSDEYAFRVWHRGNASQQYGIYVRTLTDQNDATRTFLDCVGNASLRASIRSNGGLANYQSNNANLCDEREKKNIETLDSTWGCLKSWELKKFHYNEDADTDDKRYGVIAQQVAPHCPELITDWVKQRAEDAVLDDDGNVVTEAKEEIVRMGVKEQQMMWMAIKALQEAQVRIETLEAEVAALKAA